MNVFVFRCKSCGKEYKRYGYQVYRGDPTRCAKCNKEIPFDGEDDKEKVK
jgi:phage FluMu protein Com